MMKGETSMPKIKLSDLLIYIISAELVGALSALFAGSSFAFYKEVIQPPFAPPAWVFPVTWTILYALMGVSAYLIHMAQSSKKRAAFTVYWMQLGVNFLWTIVFFRLRMVGLSIAVILLLLMLIVVMLVVFRRVRPAAAYLNIPYLLWTAFAAYLNIGIFVLNGSPA